MKRVPAAQKPRPATERGRKHLNALAYQRAMAEVRERHRDEFEQCWAHHLDRLRAEAGDRL